MEANQKNTFKSTNGVVRFENVGMRYGTGPEVLRDVSFSLNSASFHFLVGPSGAGKSSLLKLLYLASLPSRGLISLFGRDTALLTRNNMIELRREIGVVFQNYRLLNHLSVFDNVALPLRLTKNREEIIKKHVVELLTWVDLHHYLDAKPPTLSGGQQQRVAIARAVIGKPSLLLADEPTGNVDDPIAMRLLHLFEELNRHGTTVVIATHNDALISRFPHPQMRLESGRLSIIPSKPVESNANTIVNSNIESVDSSHSSDSLHKRGDF